MQKQRLTIPLAGGIATGQDGKLLPIGKSDELQNVRPGRVGEVKERPGTRALGTTMIGTADAMPAAWALGTLRGDLVNFAGVGDHPANLYSTTANAWATNTAGGFAAVQTKRRGPISATLQQISAKGLLPDVFYSAGYYWVIYSTTRNGVASIVETVIDAATGEPVGEILVGLTAVSWGVRVVNGSAVFVYADATRIFIDTWPTASVGSGSTNRVLAAKAVVNGGRQFDMLVKDSTTISVAYSDGTLVQCFDYVPTGAAATFWTPKSAAAANIQTDYAIAWMQDTGFGGAGKIALVVHEPGGIGLRVHWDIPTVGATRQAVTSYTMDAAAASPCTVAGFTRSNAATGEFTVVYDNTLQIIKMATREAGVIGAPVTPYRSLFIGSKPFIGADGKYYLGTEFYSPSQPTRFVVRIPETLAVVATATSVVAKTQVNNGYVNGTFQGPLCSVSNPATGEYVYGNTVQLRLPGNPTAYIPQGVGIDLVHIKFKALPDATTSPPREAIDSLFTPGGAIGQFDGRTYCDAGYGYYPEQPSSTVGAGALAAGTYYYALVYAWVDFNGRTWYSAPSAIKAIVTGAATGNSLGCPTYAIADRDDIQIQVYRGAVNDNITLALIGSVANNPAVSSVTFLDDGSAGQAGTALYTNGAQGNRPLAADGIPGGSALTVTSDRAWFISNDNPYEVWPSNKFIPGQGWRFSEQNKLILNDSLGPCTGIATLPNGVVVIFKANAYYLVSGDGPNQAGNGGSFTVSTPAVGFGTDNARTILETPSGIEFRANNPTRAWARVNTALQAEYIGSPIERYTSSIIVGAVRVTATGETRYYTNLNDGGLVKTLVHDAISDTWLVDTSADDFGNNTAACAYNGYAAVALQTGFLIAVDDTTTAKDIGASFQARDVTPWIKGADLDGYVEFVRVRGVGETANGAPVISCALQADFDTTTTIVTGTASPGPLWDWELKYPAKLSAFRFVLTYTTNAVPVKMTALVVEYGVKSGLNPTTYTKRMQ